MKVIIAGTRTLSRYSYVLDAVKASGFCSKNDMEVVSGMAFGIDTLAVDFAERNNLKVHEFPANWKKYKMGAGYIRNREMAEFSDALIAIWDGKSKGTKHMIEEANKLHLKVYVHVIV